MVIVDTPVWSEFYRRKQPDPTVRDALRKLIQDGAAMLLGPIRQELLSGIQDAAQFGKLLNGLRGFANEQISTEDYEMAASYSNRCRAAGIQGSNTDFLICAIGVRTGASIFTLDADFKHFARIVPIRLFDPAETIA